MSHNTNVELKIKDPQMLALALQEVFGLKPEEIEIHAKAVTIKGYYGTTTNLAHVVVRKEALRRATGAGWADCGFHIVDGKATFNHDNLDAKLSASYGKISGQYARFSTIAAARKLGRKVTEVVENGKLKIRVEK